MIAVHGLANGAGRSKRKEREKKKTSVTCPICRFKSREKTSNAEVAGVMPWRLRRLSERLVDLVERNCWNWRSSRGLNWRIPARALQLPPSMRKHATTLDPTAWRLHRRFQGLFGTPVRHLTINNEHCLHLDQSRSQMTIGFYRC